MIWKKGDIITEERFNRIKRGFLALPKSIALTYTVDEDGSAITYTLDKKYDEIIDLIKLGYISYIIYGSSIYYLRFFNTHGLTFQSRGSSLTFDVNSNGYVYRVEHPSIKSFQE